MLDDCDDIHPLFHGAPATTEFKKLRKRLVRYTREAIDQYGMIAPPRADGTPPKWLVCLSGGKDSYTLLAVLYELKWRGLLPVDLLACNLDQGQPGFPATVLPAFLEKMGVPHRIEYQDTYSIVMDKVPAGRTFCALCSRLRRGVAEVDCEAFAKAMNYPIIPCDLCGSQDGLQRQQVKQMLDGWEKTHPGRRQKMFRALMNTRPSHLLDPKIFDFAALATNDPAEANEP